MIINDTDLDQSMADSQIELEEVMLTTTDNPYNPFEQWDEWFAFDTAKDYNTCSYLARIAKSSDELTEIEETLSINRAIDEIVKYNILGIYIKVTRQTFKDRSKTAILPTD